MAVVNAPTIEEAKSLAFPDLVRIIRVHLGAGHFLQASGEAERQIIAWIDVLESQIPPPPEKPQLIESTKPHTRVANAQHQNAINRKKWSAQLERWHTSNDIAVRIISNLRRDCFAVFHQPLPLSATRVPWRLLSPSGTGEERVLSALQDYHRRWPEIRVDESRLRYAYSLKPEQVFIGEHEFDSYFAFVFGGGVKVLLENPIEGNAAYIFDQDWRLLSKLSKSELLAHHREHVIRVIHSLKWKADIKKALRYAIT